MGLRRSRRAGLSRLFPLRRQLIASPGPRVGWDRGARWRHVNLRVDKPRALILATWPMPRGVHPRMLVRRDLLLSQSHRGPTFETEAPGPLSSLRAPVQGHRGALRERRSGRGVRGRLETEGSGRGVPTTNRFATCASPAARKPRAACTLRAQSTGGRRATRSSRGHPDLPLRDRQYASCPAIGESTRLRRGSLPRVSRAGCRARGQVNRVADRAPTPGRRTTAN